MAFKVVAFALPACITMSLTLVPAISLSQEVAGSADRVRTIVTTDPELDDLNSLIRFLLYSNEVDVLGLITASSGVHWKGDGQGTEFMVEDREYTRFGLDLCPCTEWRWYDNHIEDAVDAYAQVFDNLVVHDERYPAPEQLRDLIVEGNIAFDGDISEDSPGSDLIKSVLLDDDRRPIYLQAWGGPSTIARALYSIEQDYSDTDEWDEVHARVSEKAIITAFGTQDHSYRDYISIAWPDVELRQLATTIWGYGARNVVLPGHEIYLSTTWTQANVSSRGPLGELYRVWGDGKQMVEDDIFDPFGYSGLTGTELRERGYIVWTPIQEPGSWISEGDSSAFLNLIDNGLRSHEHAGWGGWGGRAQQSATVPSEWIGRDARDFNAFNGTPADYAAARWFEDAQLDFAARLVWSTTADFEAANHRPEANVDQQQLSASTGETVTLSATATDPDGDDVTFKWWHYREAGTYPESIQLQGAGTEMATLAVPQMAQPGDTIHVILEVADNGSPRLKHYQRVVVTVLE